MSPDRELAAADVLFTLEPRPGRAINRRLTLLRSDGQSAVFAGGLPLHRWDSDDAVGERMVMVSLAQSGLAKQRHLAAAFGVHENTVARGVRRVEASGLAALVPAKRGPKGPHKVSPAVLRLVEEHADLGRVSLQRLVEERTGLTLHSSHLSRLQRRYRRARTEQPELLVADEREVAAEAAREVPADAAVVAEEDPAAVLPEASRGRYVGAALYYPALEALGLIEAARACFRLPNAERFGVRATTLTLFYLGLLGKTTVEAAKHLRRFEFGPLIGVERSPAVKTLRRKLAALVQQGQAGRFAELLSRRWVEAALVGTAYLYVDGHMKVYSGKRTLADVWNAQRRMPLPGVLSYFVNDQQGRPLLFVTEEANASLAKAMPAVIAAIRGVLGERRFTVIFDRGGYDSKLFSWLRAEGIDFITYQRGSPDLPAERFGRRECRFEGQRVRMQIAEDEVRVGRSGPWRRIVVRTTNGHQTPILTSLGGEVGSAKIACLMFARWRQENFFRYMREHHGLDQLLGYAFAAADGGRLVPNPERKKIERQLNERRSELVALRAALGGAVLAEPRQGSRSAHGLKIAQQGAVGKVRVLEQLIAELTQTRRALPKQVPLAQAGPREVLRLEEKAIIDRIKIAAYNAEEWLLERLAHHYHNPHDIRALLRSFAQLSGEVRTTSSGVSIALDAPDIPAQRQALRGLCADLNQLGVTFPGANLPVTYEVEVHHSEQAA